MTNWKCSKCGYVVKEESPPNDCPMCKQSCAFVDDTNYVDPLKGKDNDKAKK